MAAVFSITKYAFVDFSSISRLWIIQAIAAVTDQFGSWSERFVAMLTWKWWTSIPAFTRVHFQQLFALKILCAHPTGRCITVGCHAKAQEMSSTFFFFFLLLSVSINVGLEWNTTHLFLTNFAGHPRQILVDHTDVMTQDIARLVLPVTDVAFKLLHGKTFWIVMTACRMNVCRK
jgi:hypothetical protein